MKNNDVFEMRRSKSVDMRPHEVRHPYERDRARIIHSAAFRRLQAKTQVLGIREGDFHRTRLTHSMEVAQVGRGIVLQLKNNREKYNDYLPPLELIEAIGLAHDLGHPPFGHGGEIALNYMMRDHGGFEGNGQTLRLLSKYEAHTHEYGLDLTRRSLLGILKYPVPYSRVVCHCSHVPNQPFTQVKASDWKPPKCYLDEEQSVVDWILSEFDQYDQDRFKRIEVSGSGKVSKKPTEKSFDTSIMELADDISYAIHDFEDAISLGIVSLDDWRCVSDGLESEWKECLKINDIECLLFSSSSHARKDAIGRLVNAAITGVYVEECNYYSPLLMYRAKLKKEAGILVEKLKRVVTERVILTQNVQTLEYRGQQMVMKMFEALYSDGDRLLKDTWKKYWEKASNDKEKMRIVCDYIAGMTDEYATRLYERLFVPRHGSVFSRL